MHSIGSESADIQSKVRRVGAVSIRAHAIDDVWASGVGGGYYRKAAHRRLTSRNEYAAKLPIIFDPFPEPCV